MHFPKWRYVFVICVVLFTVFSFVACSAAQQFIDGGGKQSGLSEKRIIEGLKEALTVGTGNSVGILNKKDGYFRDNAVKILLPPDVRAVERELRLVGGGAIADRLVEQMNRGAEDAASEAVGIFVDSIKGMTIQDARGILFGADNAATEYFKRRTTATLMTRYERPVKNSLEKVHAVSTWRELTTTYNKIPAAMRTKTLETDLVKYVTERALDGLFKKVEIEERKIRKEPTARVNNLLREVFGELDKKK